jgi:hypothetical protein
MAVHLIWVAWVINKVSAVSHLNLVLLVENIQPRVALQRGVCFLQILNSGDDY